MTLHSSVQSSHWLACAAAMLAIPATLAAQGVPIAPVAPDKEAIVNAPVAPEAIYIGREGSSPSVSVLDLNGLGQGTGNLATSRWPLNPNIGQPGVTPALALGTSVRDAGGAGVLTLTADTTLSTELLRGCVTSVRDIHIGQPLDLLYNGEGRNRALIGNQVNPATLAQQAGNTISVAPHPNPPRLVVPAPVPERLIEAEEPSVTTSRPFLGRVTTSSPPCLPSTLNLLVPGFPFHWQFPGLFDARYSGIFVGPQPPPAIPNLPIPYCPYTSRQQVGHFLYVIDRTAQRVLCVNSNRFTLLHTVPLADPASAAMAPNLRWLAVSNFAQGTVSFVDVDPRSPTFHRVLGAIPVGRGPTGLAWQPEGEDLLVCNSLDDTVSVISAMTFSVRKVLRTGIRRPQDVAVTGRQLGFGVRTSTYFALIRNGDGTLASYESGPVPFGPDDSTALALPLPNASVVHARLSVFHPEFFVAHTDGFGLGQVSLITVLTQGALRAWTVTQRYGGTNSTMPIRDLFSGNALVDLAFDETYNDGAAQDVPSILPGLTYAPHSGKGQFKQAGGGIIPSHRSLLMFAASGDTGRVDVMDLNTGQILKRIDAPGVTCLSHYWRQ